MLHYPSRNLGIAIMFKNLSHSLSQQTPLHIAAREGRDYTAKWLVEKGAHINIKDYNEVCLTILLTIH